MWSVKGRQTFRKNMSPLSSESAQPCLPPRFLLGLYFGPENGGDMFLGRLSTDYTALYPRRWYSSQPPLWEPQILHVTILLSSYNLLKLVVIQTVFEVGFCCQITAGVVKLRTFNLMIHFGMNTYIKELIKIRRCYVQSVITADGRRDRYD
jgi:hypothetical protein